MVNDTLHFVFDGPPGPEGGRFVECETPDGCSVKAGEWHERADGLWELRVPRLQSAPAMEDVERVARAMEPVLRDAINQRRFAGYTAERDFRSALAKAFDAARAALNSEGGGS